jgi:transposase
MNLTKEINIKQIENKNLLKVKLESIKIAGILRRTKFQKRGVDGYSIPQILYRIMAVLYMNRRLTVLWSQSTTVANCLKETGKDCYYRFLKNELGENRLRVHSTEAMRGRLFLMFLATILYKALSCRMKESGLFKKYTIAEVLLILKQIKAITLSNDQSILSEVSKKQRDILTALKIPIPEIPCY